MMRMCDIVSRYNGMTMYEKLSAGLLLPATILFSIAALTHAWFELPGVAFYGLWWAKFCYLDECHLVPAFFTKEPGYYHLLQLLNVLAWGGLALSMYMLCSNKMDYRIPRFLKGGNRNYTIALVCFTSVFAMSGGLYLFYHIVDSFPRKSNQYPEIHWAGVSVTVACTLQFLAGILLLHV